MSNSSKSVADRADSKDAKHRDDGDASMSDGKDAKQQQPVKGLLDDAGDGDNMLQLVSQEQEKFSLPKKIAIMSELVKTMADGDQSETEIPLPNVKGAVLNKIIVWMKRHGEVPMKEIEKPLKSANMNEVVEQWDADYVDVDQELLFELILAANYMDIKPLLDLTCAKVASIIKNKTPEQIRKTFNIVNDFTVCSHCLFCLTCVVCSPRKKRRYAPRISGPKRIEFVVCVCCALLQ
jgi:S-phase kinase-associated protein 1